MLSIEDKSLANNDNSDENVDFSGLFATFGKINNMSEAIADKSPEILKEMYLPLGFSRSTLQQGNIGYLGSSDASLKPYLIIDKAHIVNPINDNNTSKFGVPCNRVSSADDIGGICTSGSIRDCSNTYSSKYAEFSVVNLSNQDVDTSPIMNQSDYNKIVAIMKEGVFI